MSLKSGLQLMGASQLILGGVLALTGLTPSVALIIAGLWFGMAAVADAAESRRKDRP